MVEQAGMRRVRFAVAASFELPTLGEPLPPARLRDTYFDSPDHRLLRGGLALRYRLDGEQGVWQLELAGGEPLELIGANGTPPERFRALLAATLRGAELAPLVTLVIERSGYRVGRAGAGAAEVHRDRVRALGRGAERDGCLDEVALLTLPGGDLDGEAADRLERRLTRLGAQPLGQKRRLARLLELELPVAPPRAGGAADPVGRVLAALADALAQLVAHDPGTRLGRDPEELHAMRVAVRRLRTILRVARPLLERRLADELRADLAPLGRLLGEVRDLDVLTAQLGDLRDSLPAAERPGGEALLETLARERDRARSSLLELLSESGYPALLERFEVALASGALAGTPQPLLRLARREHGRLRREVSRLEGDPSAEALHRVRLAGRRARYTAELLAGEGDESVRRYVAAARHLHETLGIHQDTVVAEAQLLEAARASGSAAVGIAAGRLAQIEVERRSRARRELPAAWHALARQGRRAWKQR
jgi:CHAD domain-containing protein